jgi:hypothetical protein
MSPCAGATLSSIEGADDRRSSPRTVLAAHRPPVVISKLDTKQMLSPYSKSLKQETEACAVAASPDLELNTMTDIRENRPNEEPIGIVISRGSRAESTPRFAAYVWSQVGDATPTVSEPRAA